MADKITINPVQAGNGLETAINLRLQQIEDAFNDNVLWRAGFAGSPNQMDVDLDLNGNDILNAGDIQIEGYGGLTSSIATLDAAVQNRVQISGDTMTGPLTLSGDPVNALHAATRQFVIDTVSSGGAILTTKGDLVTYDTATTRLPVGTNGQTLVANSATATGLEWQDASGGIADTLSVAFVDSPVTPVADTLYNVDTSGGNVTFTLPACSGNDGLKFAVKKTTSDANSIVLDPDGTDEIDGVATTYSLTKENEGATVLCDESTTPDGWNTMAWGPSTSYIGSVGDAEAAVIYMGRDLSAGTSYIGNVSVASEAPNPRVVTLKPDGTKMYVASATTIYQYSLSTPWLVSSATYDSVSVSTGLTGVVGMNFKPDGTKVFLVDSVGRVLYIKPLTVAWDITTLTTSGQSSYSVAAITGECNGGYMNPDGTYAYWCNGLNPDTMEQLILTENWDIGSATTVYGGSKSVFAENPSVEGMAFSPDGTKMWNLDDSVGLYQYTLSTPYDIRTATYDSYVFSMTAQDTSVWGLNFSPDGRYMYVPGHDTDSILMYQLTMDEIVAPATQSTFGSVQYADYSEAFDGELHYKAISPATAKKAFIDSNQQTVNITDKKIENPSNFCVWIGDGVAANIDNNSIGVIAIGHEAYSGHISSTSGNAGPMVAIGQYAGAMAKGGDNYFIGQNAGRGPNGGWSGAQNVGIGTYALGQVSGSVYYNTAVGHNAVRGIYSGANYNAGFGYNALGALISASNNNTGIGARAGYTCNFGSNNIFLGYNAGPTSTSTQNNQLYIDVTARNDALIRGDFSARSVTINGSLSVAGGLSGGYVSDGTGTTLDFSAGLMHAIAPTAASNPTYTFTAPSAGASCTILGTNLGAAGTITWPATVKWEGGVEPTWTAAGVDRIKLEYDGTNYYAAATLNHA